MQYNMRSGQHGDVRNGKGNNGTESLRDGQEEQIIDVETKKIGQGVTELSQTAMDRKSFRSLVKMESDIYGAWWLVMSMYDFG